MRPLPQTVVRDLATTSAKIRALAAAGFERTKIRDFLKISYQHVRNVLVKSGGQNAGMGSVPTRDGINATPPKEIVVWRREKLLDAGFVLLGEWRSIDEGSFALTAAAPKKPGVYAFVVDGDVRYIGLTQTGIRIRMGHYVYGHVRQRTSARVKALILEALAAGSTIEVMLAFPPMLEWNGLPLDGPAGLEAGLLRVACPTWNKQGVVPRLEGP